MEWLWALRRIHREAWTGKGPQEREQGLERTALWGVSAESDGQNPRMVPQGSQCWSDRGSTSPAYSSDGKPHQSLPRASQEQCVRGGAAVSSRSTFHYELDHALFLAWSWTSSCQHVCVFSGFISTARILIQSSFFHTDSEQFYLQRLSLVKVCIWVPQTGNVLKTPQHMAERAFMLSCERDTW